MAGNLFGGGFQKPQIVSREALPHQYNERLWQNLCLLLPFWELGNEHINDWSPFGGCATKSPQADPDFLAEIRAGAVGSCARIVNDPALAASPGNANSGIAWYFKDWHLEPWGQHGIGTAGDHRFTVLAVYRNEYTGSQFKNLCSGSASNFGLKLQASTGLWQFDYDATPAKNTWTMPSQLNDTGVHAIAFSSGYVSGDPYQFAIDGVAGGTGTTAAVASKLSDNTFNIAGDDARKANQSWWGDVYLFAVWDELKPLAELQALTNDPFAILTPRNLRPPHAWENSISDGIKAGSTRAVQLVGVDTVTDGIDAGSGLGTQAAFEPATADGIAAGDENASQSEMQSGVADGIDAGDAQSAQAVMGDSVNLGALSGSTLASQLSAENALAYGLSVGLTLDSLLSGVAAAALGIDAGYTLDSQAAMGSAANLGLVVGDGAAGGLSTEDAIALGTQHGLTLIQNLILPPSVSMGIDAGSQVDALTVMGVAVAAGLDAGLSLNTLLSAVGAIALGQTLGFDVGTDAEGAFNLGLTLGKTLASQMSARDAAALGLTLGKELASLANATSSVSLGTVLGDQLSPGALLNEAVALALASGLSIDSILLGVAAAAYALDSGMTLAQTAEMEPGVSLSTAIGSRFNVNFDEIIALALALGVNLDTDDVAAFLVALASISQSTTIDSASAGVGVSFDADIVRAGETDGVDVKPTQSGSTESGGTITGTPKLN